jgi:hypothetical protein
VGGGDDKLGPEAVITGHTAFRSVLQASVQGCGQQT